MVGPPKMQLQLPESMRAWGRKRAASEPGAATTHPLPLALYSVYTPGAPNSLNPPLSLIHLPRRVVRGHELYGAKAGPISGLRGNATRQHAAPLLVDAESCIRNRPYALVAPQTLGNCGTVREHPGNGVGGVHVLQGKLRWG